MQTVIVQAETTNAIPSERSIYVWGLAAVAALGGLLFGYDWVVIGGARQFYELYFHLTSPALVGWANSCALAGCLIGTLAAGYFAERLGRKKVLLAAAILFALSSVVTGWAYSFDAFIVWRIAGGIAIGLTSNVSPLYIAEISPSEIRGRLVSFNQLAIVFGILLAQVANWLIARPVAAGLNAAAMLQTWNVQTGWRWMFSAVAVPAAVFIVASLFLPESPRWLLARGREREARTVLARIGGERYADAELNAIESALMLERTQRKFRWSELLGRPAVLRILLIGITLAVLQQWTGINTLFNYAAEVYREAGYGANDIFLNIIITGSINVVFTILAMLLVDRVGRRPLMLFGCIGIGASHLLCAWAYHAHWRGSAVLVLTLSAIACYALTLAPVVWVLIAEIFPSQIRSQGISTAIAALWIASFALTYSFPILNAKFGTGGTFMGYGLVCILGALFVAFYVVETKGRSLEQIGADVVM
jgi:sugar porter (SP) family MFS transporter